MKVDVLLGLQWGDEGKGKIVDVITPNYQVIARFQGGPNAGHTLEFNGLKHVLHTIPSGIFRDNAINVIGNGVVIDPIIFVNEIEKLLALNVDIKSRLFISKKAHLILPTHRVLDAASEAMKGKEKIGSTLKGIGPTYMDKTGRNGLRVGDTQLPNFKQLYNQLKEKHLQILKHSNYQFDVAEQEANWFAAIDRIKELKLIDSEFLLNETLLEGKRILAEGAQGSLLDVDFGTYPFVTSSNTMCAGACTGLGVAPNKIGEVYGIFKAYCTRVGSGPFPTELDNHVGETMRKIGNEFGSTTGRSRRCGWLDLPALKYAIMINGVTQLIMMKADVLNDFETLQVCTHYKVNGEISKTFPYDINHQEIEPIYQEFKGWKSNIQEQSDYENLPTEFKSYVEFIEEYCSVPVKIISTGPNRLQTIVR
jgi:adenylosuccinate synthase